MAADIIVRWPIEETFGDEDLGALKRAAELLLLAARRAIAVAHPLGEARTDRSYVALIGLEALLTADPLTDLDLSTLTASAMVKTALGLATLRRSDAGDVVDWDDAASRLSLLGMTAFHGLELREKASGSLDGAT